MNTKEIVVAIIKEQSQIIGEYLALSMAQNSGVVTSPSSKIEEITIANADGTLVIDTLVNTYEKLFGPASVEVCRNVIKRYANQ